MSEQLIQTPGTFGENGNFLLERELGSGGMGGVYMGRDKMLDRPVAVKVMLKEFGDDAEFVEKFKKEAQACARLIHPNIAQIFSYGICDGMPYMAMELASGGSLYSIMNANPGKTDIARVIKICQQTAQALQCASDQGFVHGDVKPENILLDSNGNAKLVDFGLAAMQKDTDEIWGTPYYISPEKVKRETIDFRADMYSLGGTLYHALTGVAPFEGEDSIAVVKKRFEGAPKKPSEIRPELTTAIDNLVMKMLALNKEDRFPSFEALIEAFKEVLTNGLTKTESHTTTAAAKRPTTGTRRMTVRGRRITTLKKAGVTKTTTTTSTDAAAKDEAGNVIPTDEDAENPTEGSEENIEKGEDSEEEGGGHLGLKIVGVIVGIVLVIGGIIGGLVWYRIADAKSRAAEVQAQIVAGVAKARGAIKDTVANAIKFADEFDDFAQKAVDAVKQPTAELMKIMPQNVCDQLRPGPSKELMDAIAATNETPVAVEAPVASAAPASTNAAPAATNTNAAPAVAKSAQPAVNTNAPASKAVAKAPAPAAKKETAKAPAAKAPPAAPATTNAAPAISATGTQVIAAMTELWNRAYSCQASAVRIRHAVRQVVKRGAEADLIQGDTRENVEKLAELSRAVVEMLDTIKGSKDVENVRKGITFIKQKGEKTVEQTVKRLRIEKLESDRKAKAEAAAEAEKARLEKIEAERKAKVEAETNEAKSKFETIVAQGSIRQLDWTSAIRQLKAMQAEFKTPEGQLAADVEIQKIEDMKKVQDIFIKSMTGFLFRKKPFAGAKVISVTDKEINLVKGKAKVRSTWQKFYKNNPGNLNELINHFIIQGRKNAKPALNLKDWADANTGAALTMQLVCSEVNGAVERSQEIAKDVAAKFPERTKQLKAIFPEIEFPASEESSEE